MLARENVEVTGGFVGGSVRSKRDGGKIVYVRFSFYVSHEPAFLLSLRVSYTDPYTRAFAAPHSGIVTSNC